MIPIGCDGEPIKSINSWKKPLKLSNQLTPIDDLELSSQSGVIKTSSSLTMNGGNINLFDYSTGLIQSQFYTDSTGLIVKTATTKDIRFRIASTDIATISTSGLTMNGSLPILSATNTNLILNVPSSGYQMTMSSFST